ncbi:TPA: hypothetical protein LRL19_004557, partial [Escherichia coli]|nr:hypothetical protein [Escherichia coli]
STSKTPSYTKSVSWQHYPPFAKADGSMGPKVTAVSGYVRSRGKPAWIGALSRIEETLAGEAGTCISL